MISKPLQVSVLAASALVAVAEAAELNPIFQDNAVLQCDARVPVWGTASDGEAVTVEFNGKSASTTAENGTWKVWLDPMAPNAEPQTLTVTGDNVTQIENILVGEVWIASGQSNMERHLGLASGQKPIDNWEQEVADSDYPQIRQFYVPQVKAYTPQDTVAGSWSVCSPETVENFSAVAYFFARDLFRERHVPIGIVHSSWGGTPAEAWTSEAGLSDLPDFDNALEDVHQFAKDPKLADSKKQSMQQEWLQHLDPMWPSNGDAGVPSMDTSEWKAVEVPAYVEDSGFPGFDGIIWYQRSFELPADWDGHDAELHLGSISYMDTTWVNGNQVGMTAGWGNPRVYHVPGNTLKPGHNVLTVRVLDAAGGGGLFGGGNEIRLSLATDGSEKTLPLSGSWKCQTSTSSKAYGWPPAQFFDIPSDPTVLYNAMIHPLLPYAMRGVIWYQGEANVGRERQYQKLFPAMIADWRRLWGEGDFPFLFVQIAPFSGSSPEIREAQLMTEESVPNTAMAVTIDVGDANDIHPPHKQPVGARLALAARALAYGEDIEYSGPIYQSMEAADGQAVLTFSHVGGGLVAKGGELVGFTIAGPDKVFHPAQARIVGDTIVVSGPEVPNPAAVRYAWASVPEANLYNKEGIPASSFRSDVD